MHCSYSSESESLDSEELDTSVGSLSFCAVLVTTDWYPEISKFLKLVVVVCDWR